MSNGQADEDDETHSCEWEYEGKWYPGTAQLSTRQRPRGDLFGWILPVEESMGFPEEIQTDLLWGRLRNNEDIAVIDALLEVWWVDRAHVSGRAAIVGLGLREDESLHFSRAVLQVSALPALIGTLPLVRYSMPPPGDDPLEGTYTVEGYPAASLDWQSPLGIVACDYNLNVAGFDGFHWHIDTIPEITVTPPQSATVLEYFERWVTPIRQLAAFLTGLPQQATKLIVTRNRPGNGEKGAAPDGQFRVYAAHLGQKQYTASRPNPLEFIPMYRFNELPYDLPLLIARWKELTDRYPQALKPYLNTLFQEDLPLRAVFLYRVQTLEAIHRALEDPAIYTKHDAIRADVLKRTKALGLEKPLRRFLHERLDRHGGPSLKIRLGDLVDRLPPAVRDADSVSVLAQEVPPIRDNLVHGLKEYEPPDLLPLSFAMKTVADAHFLDLLQLSPEHALRLGTAVRRSN